MLSLITDGERCEKTGRGGEEEVRRRMEVEEMPESLGRTEGTNLRRESSIRKFISL